MPCETGGLRFVFDELNRNTKPCVNLDKASDLFLLNDALTFSNEHCIQLDGCCSSRVFASLAALKDPSSISDPAGFSDLVSKQEAYATLVGVLCPSTSTSTCNSCTDQ